VTAVLEWWVSPDATESAGAGEPRPHKRVYLSRDPAGWSDVQIAPPRTEHMRVFFCHWRQLGPVPLGGWDFACECAGAIPPRTFRAAVAYQQTDPGRPQTMESRRDLTVATIKQVSPEGQVIGVYRKRHLTQMELESGLTPGDAWWPVFDTPLGRIGMLACWDGWFPASAAALARRTDHLFPPGRRR